MPALKVDVVGVEPLLFKLGEGIPKPLTGLMHKIRAKAVKEVKTRSRPHTGDSGRLANAIKGTLFREQLGALRVPAGAKVSLYAAVAQQVEEGRRPGKPPGFRSLQRWMKAHGLNASSASVSALRLKLGTAGTRGVGMMKKGGEATVAALPGLVKDTEAKLKQEWG